MAAEVSVLIDYGHPAIAFSADMDRIDHIIVLSKLPALSCRANRPLIAS